jgi:putative transposase
MDVEEYRAYKHNPPHLFRPNAIYMVTASTLRGRRLMQPAERRRYVIATLFERAENLGWRLEAWAVLPNHYHLVARAPGVPSTLTALVRSVHSIAAKSFNREDGTPGRQVWHNYWDTCLQSEKAYWAGLQYVHLNAVRHGLVREAEEYPFCSYGWFKERAKQGFKDKVLSQRMEAHWLKEVGGDFEA